MFRDAPLHDWTSHPADMFRYAAVVEDQMIDPRRPPKTASRVPVVSGADGWMG
jgi:hypothetical protein